MIASTHLAGVRIDSVDLKSAVDLIESAVNDRSPMQISTVNLDFLSSIPGIGTLPSPGIRSDGWPPKIG